eukprot:Em0004g810a
MEGLKRMLAKPKVRKEPVMANILKAMVEATGPEPPLSDVSYSRLRELLLDKIAKLGFDPALFAAKQDKHITVAGWKGTHAPLWSTASLWAPCSTNGDTMLSHLEIPRVFATCSHHPHLYTVEEDCAPAKGDEDILYLHTGQDQAGTDIIRSYVAFQLVISVSHKYWLGGGQPMACRTNPTPGIRVHWSGTCGPHLHRLPYPVDTTHPRWQSSGDVMVISNVAGHGMVTKRIKSSIWTQLATTTSHKSSAGSGI